MDQVKSIYEVAEQYGDRCFEDGCHGRHWVDATMTAFLNRPRPYYGTACALVMRCAEDHEILISYTCY